MVENEAKTLAKMNHEHILKYIECFRSERHFCIVTEWLSMDTYDYININYSKLTENCIKHIFRMTVKAIQYCH